MARPRKEIEVPGQEITQKSEEAGNVADALLLNSVAGGIEQHPANTPEELNAATAGATVTAGPVVTNEEGKKQPVHGKPVLTEHGWHVPG